MSDCKFCGKEVVSKEGRKPKEFCNGNCRNKFYYKQAAAVRTPKKIGRPKKDELVFQQAKSRRMGQKGFINMVEKIDSKINFKEATQESYDGERLNPLIQDEVSQLPTLPAIKKTYDELLKMAKDGVGWAIIEPEIQGNPKVTPNQASMIYSKALRK